MVVAAAVADISVVAVAVTTLAAAEVQDLLAVLESLVH
jgi:hypothetical protein